MLAAGRLVRMGACVAAGLTVATGFCRTGQAEVVSLTPSQDNSIYSESASSSNGQGITIFTGFTLGGDERRALLRFDLSAIPAHSMINSVSLKVFAVSSGPIPSGTMDLRRILGAWGEGSSDAGDPGGHGIEAEAGDATWTMRMWPSTAWTTPGGDLAAAVSASTSGPPTGRFSWSSAGMVADVSAWVNNPASNFGWAIVSTAGSGNARSLVSRSGEDVSSRPVLNVDFTPPCVADLDDNGAAPASPDGGVDINDLLFYLQAFEAGLLDADLDDGSGTGVHDSGVDINDLLFFLAHFEAGC